MELGNCLERALALVRGDRGRDYGRPRDDYGRTAALWSAYLGVPVTAEQAAVCMILVKVSRLAHSPGHADSIIDIAGYAAVVEDCADAAKMDAVSAAADAVVRDAEVHIGDGVVVGHYSSRPDAKPMKPRESDPFVRLCRVAGILRDAIGPSPGETIEGTAERAASLLRPKKPKLSEVVPFAIVVPYEGLCGFVCPKDSLNGWLVHYQAGRWLTSDNLAHTAKVGDRFVQINWRSIFEGGAS